MIFSPLLNFPMNFRKLYEIGTLDYKYKKMDREEHSLKENLWIIRILETEGA